MKRRALVLGGVKHCGKSTLGKLLAAILERRFVDTDVVLERLYADQCGEKRTSREIFREEGEEFFRALEAEAVENILRSPQAHSSVIALGGGVVSNPLLQAQKLEWGTRVWLKAPPDLICQRIEAGGWPPFLPEGNGFERWFYEREKAFQAWADCCFEIRHGEMPMPAAERLVKFLEQSQ